MTVPPPAGYRPGDPRDDFHLVREALASELEAAKQAGQVGYMARLLAQATLPHSDPKATEFRRSNGLITLTIIAPASVGLPYGSVPRLLLAWLTTEAVRTRSRTLVLGATLSSFMHQLDLVPTGGRWGTIPRLRTQMSRLFSSQVQTRWEEPGHERGEKLDVAKRWELWWDPKSPEQAALWKSTVTLDTEFFEEVLAHHFPVDLRALRALRRSPMALDIYAWLTWRMSFLSGEVTIPWPALQHQFGANYGLTRSFRHFFQRALVSVLAVYPEPRVRPYTHGLVLRESGTSVRRAPRHPGRSLATRPDPHLPHRGGVFHA
jgi:Plasmid encoded RepA protein